MTSERPYSQTGVFLMRVAITSLTARVSLAPLSVYDAAVNRPLHPGVIHIGSLAAGAETSFIEQIYIHP